MIGYLLIFLLGGIARRIAGAGGIKEARLARLPWVLFITFLMAGLTGNLWMLLIVPLPAYLGICVGYFGAEFNVQEKQNRKPKNLLLLTLRGMFTALPIFIVTTLIQIIGTQFGLYICSSAGIGGIAAGIFFALCYLVGIPIQNFLRKYNIKIPHLQTFSQWGEFLSYGLIAVGIALTTGAV